MSKKVIYKISGKNNKPIASIYGNGKVTCLSKIPGAKKLIKESLKFGFHCYKIDAAEITLLKTGDMWNPRYPRAFLAVCFITCGAPNDKPPFGGFEVEYLGEGEPWERALPEGAVI